MITQCAETFAIVAFVGINVIGVLSSIVTVLKYWWESGGPKHFVHDNYLMSVVFTIGSICIIHFNYPFLTRKSSKRRATETPTKKKRHIKTPGDNSHMMESPVKNTGTPGKDQSKKNDTGKPDFDAPLSSSSGVKPVNIRTPSSIIRRKARNRVSIPECFKTGEEFLPKSAKRDQTPLTCKSDKKNKPKSLKGAMKSLNRLFDEADSPVKPIAAASTLSSRRRTSISSAEISCVRTELSSIGRASKDVSLKAITSPLLRITPNKDTPSAAGMPTKSNEATGSSKIKTGNRYLVSSGVKNAMDEATQNISISPANPRHLKSSGMQLAMASKSSPIVPEQRARPEKVSGVLGTAGVRSPERIPGIKAGGMSPVRTNPINWGFKDTTFVSPVRPDGPITNRNGPMKI